MTIFFQQTDDAIGGDDQNAYCSGLTVAGSGSVGNNASAIGGTAGVTVRALGGNKDLDAGVTRAVVWMEVPVNSTDWAAGDWVVRLNITLAASPLEWSSTHICRLNSSYVNQATVGSLTGQTTDLSTTGVKTHTVSGAIQSGVSAGDVAMIILGFTVPSGGMDEKPRYLPDQIIDQPEAAGGGLGIPIAAYHHLHHNMG